MSKDSSTAVAKLIPVDKPKTAREAYRPDPAKKVAIVGFASSTRGQAPFGDQTFEVWGLNSLYAFVPRWTRWFEIHPKDHVRKDLKRAELQQLGVDHYGWLKSHPGPEAGDKFAPIYMQEHYPDIPASVRWPRAEINEWTVSMFGPEAELDYFTSTPGEMVAHAIYEGFGEIHLYGIDLLQDEEYAYQRPGCEYWLGIARGLGIKVYVPKESALLKANYVYGYSEPPFQFGTMQPLVKFFEEKNTQMEQAQHEVAAMVNTVNGARQAFGAIVERVDRGETTEQLKAYSAAELEQLAKKFEQGRETLVRLSAQRELAVSSASWIGHYARGGMLEGDGKALEGNYLPGPIAAGSSDAPTPGPLAPPAA